MGLVKIREVPAEERPRERLVQYGATSLSNSELLAILLRTGSHEQSVTELAHLLLAKVNGLRGLLDVSVNELTQVKGIGPAKAVQLMAGMELGRRLAGEKAVQQPSLSSPQAVADLMMEEMRYLSNEHFVCLFLNTKNRLIARQTIFVGSLNASIVHPREIFKEAIRRSSASIICLHNHPSGDPTPSREDIEVTRRLVKSGEIVGIEVLDHVIIGDGRFISLKESGYI